MPHVFDGHRFSRVLADAEHLAASTRDHERHLSELLTVMERSVATGAAPEPAAWLEAVRQVCAAASEQRQAAEQVLSRLAVDSPHAGVTATPRGLVLVVDDSEDNCEVTATVLEASGFRTMAAGNGLDALVVAHYASPAAVLMDISMPVLGGIEAARLLKASPVTRDVPVIAYTASPMLADAWLTHLFVEVLRKPAAPAEIVRAVARAVGEEVAPGA